MPSASEFEQFAQAQRLLHDQPTCPIFDQPLSEWVLSHDRHLPQRLLGYPLREILAQSFDQLQELPGIGERRLQLLLQVIERALCSVRVPSRPPTLHAGSKDSPATETLSGKGSYGPPSELLPLSSSEVTEAGWQACATVLRRHRVELLPLGKIACSLASLPRSLWDVPVGYYISRSFSEISDLEGHGPAKVRQVLDVLLPVARLLFPVPADAHLAILVLPAPMQDVTTWIQDALRRQAVPDIGLLKEKLVQPMLRQLEVDLRPEVIDVISRRLGVEKPIETLEAIANAIGVTRERVRQIEARGAEILRIRWAEGQHLLEDLFHALASAPGTQAQADLLRAVLDTLFDVPLERGSSRDEVLECWDTAGRQKLTPLAEAELSAWSAEHFPRLRQEALPSWLADEGLVYESDSRGRLFFSHDPLDGLLLSLLKDGEPLPLRDVLELVGGDERSVRGRLERDPRFVEDELKRVLPAEQCSFFRKEGRWFLRLDSIQGTDQRVKEIALSDLIHMAVGGLVQAGVCDATVWGVHRFTCSLLTRMYGSTLAPSVTPFVLASTLTRHSDGLVRHMRRRRLRWDSADESIPVRGKRGWIDHLATVAGVPIILDELDAALRGRFQDYEAYVLQQLNFDEDEEGEGSCGCRFVSGVSHVVPAILIPGGWELDLATMNVSEGVELLVAKIVSMSTRSPFPKAYLRRLPWLVRLCDHAAYGQMRWAERSPSPEDDLPEEEAVREPVSPRQTDQASEPAACDSAAAAVDDLLSQFL